jgi:chorismate mutase
MEIADWRNKIDELDEQIVKLLNQRAAAAVEIGKIKQQNSAPIYEPNREQAVFEHVGRVNPGPLTGTQLQDIYDRVMDVMRALQRVDSAAEDKRDAGQQVVAP